MDQQINTVKSKSWIVWMLIVLLFCLIVYVHYINSLEEGLKVDKNEKLEVTVGLSTNNIHPKQKKERTSWSLDCKLVYSDNIKSKHQSLRYRFSRSNSSSTYPAQIFPFPKIFLEENEKSHSSPASLNLQSDYYIFVEDIHLFDRYTELQLLRFCQNHQPLQHQQKNKNNNTASNTFQIQTITIQKTKNHTLSDYFTSFDYIVDDMNIEAYLLNIERNGEVEIVANTELGVNHALVTLSQLLYSSSDFYLPLKIIDWPENDWRGLMIDVSRHFQPIKLLKRAIDGMEYSKLNLLHLHLTDAQSFPILLDDDPITNLSLSNIAKLSTFAPNKHYTKNQLKELVQYAQERRIEIIPEIDVPAHSHSWGKAFADVIVRCDEIAHRQQVPLNVYPLDPSNPKTFLLIRAILLQIVEIFPSKYLHIGGDEVIENCWSTVPHVIEWTKQLNLTTHTILKYFERQVFDIVKELDKIPIVWQGVFDTGAIPDATQGSSGYPLRGSRHRTSRRNTSKKGNGERAFLHGRALTSQMLEENRNIFLNSHFDGHQSHATNGAADGDAPSDHTLSNYSTIIEPWKCWSGLAVRTAVRAVKTGHPVFMSACWYLDFQSDWTTFLTLSLLDSTAFELNYEQTSRSNHDLAKDSSISPDTKTFAPPSLANQHENYFTGGEGALWSEKVDHTNFECRTWPRTGAIAFRLWGFGGYFCDLLYEDLLTIPYQSYNHTNAYQYYYFCENYYTSSRQAMMADHTITNSQLFQLNKIHNPSKNENNSVGRGIRYPFRDEKIEIPITMLATKILYSSFVNFRYFLTNHVHINAAPIILHYPVEQSFETKKPLRALGGEKGKTQYQPFFSKDLEQIMREIEQINEGMVLASNSGYFFPVNSLKNNHTNTTTTKRHMFRITSQCLGIPEVIQRPLTSKQFSIIQFNIADGSVGERGDLMLQWLQDKAQQGVFIIGLCELVGWQTTYHKEDIVKNVPLLTLRAANAGFIYSHITQYSSKSSYPVGVVSIFPFEVIKEYYYPYFQRVVLHVYFQQFDLHVVICHLHAHSADERLKEVKYLVEQIIQPLFEQTNHRANIIVMGDLNTLSPDDQQQHEETHLSQLINSNQRNSTVFQRWKKKYLRKEEADDEKGLLSSSSIDYRPIETLLRAGLFDSCVESCCFEYELKNPSIPCPRRWSVNDQSNQYSLCMQSHCAGSEPTLYNPEWPIAETGMDHPLIRLDYIFMSKNLLLLKENNHTLAVGRHSPLLLQAGIEITNITQKISDHFPVYASWVPREQISCLEQVTSSRSMNHSEEERQCAIDLF